MAEKWQTLAEACQTLGLSERTLYRRIDKGEIQSKLEGKKRLVLVDLPNDRVESDKILSLSDVPDIQVLEQENERLKGELDALRRDLQDARHQIQAKDKTVEQAQRDAAEASQRHDTIVLQLTRQLEQSQLLLEYKSEPWYRRLFSKRKARGQEPEL